MTKAEALRVLVTTPRDHADQGRIGRRVIFDKPDRKVRMSKGWRGEYEAWKRRYAA
jgi:hypothetical protein